MPASMRNILQCHLADKPSDHDRLCHALARAGVHDEQSLCDLTDNEFNEMLAKVFAAG